MRRAPGRLAFSLALVLCAHGGCASEEPPAVEQAAPAATGATSLDGLQGRWQSTDDESFVIEVSGDQVNSWYDDEKTSVDRLVFVSDCQERAADPAGESFLLVGEESDALCYHLDQVSDDRLEYTYTARGNTLSFARQE